MWKVIITLYDDIVGSETDTNIIGYDTINVYQW